MFEATANEFPFVEALPKRQKGRVAKMLDQVKEFGALQKEHGALYPSQLVRGILGFSHQRMSQLIEAGILKAVKHHGHWFIPEAAFVEFVNTERKAGRPPKIPTTYGEMWKLAQSAAKDFVK